MRNTVVHTVAVMLAVGAVGIVAGEECDWEWVNPAPPRIDVHRLKYESRAFIGVGLAGTILRSNDGLEWETVDAGVDVELHGVDWGAGFFVAVGDGVILRSSDGYDWATVHLEPTAELLDVEFSSSKFVAVGDGLDGAVLTSQLGADWQRVSVPWSVRTDSIAGTADGFLAAVGAEIWSSPDGVDWALKDRVPASPATAVASATSKKRGADLFELDRVDIAWSGTALLWAGGSELWSGSQEGVWDLVAELIGCGQWRDWLGVVAGAGWAMASGISGCPSPYLDTTATLVFSSDGGASFGIPWETSAGGFPGLARFGSRLIAAGALGDVLTSSAGESWDCVDGSCTSSVCADEYVDLSRSLTRRVAVGGVGLCDDGESVKGRSGATTAVSANGGQWAVEPLETDRFRAVTSFADEFLAVGDGWIGRSADGVAWTIEDFYEYADLRGIASGAGWVVTVGLRGALYASDDGRNWIKPFLYFTNDLHRVVWTGEQFIALGEAGSILYSADALNWSLALASSTAMLRSAAAGPDELIAVGSDGTILASTDAEVWLARRSGLGSTFTDVVWGDDRYVAVGWDELPDGTRPAVLAGSADGHQWTRLPVLGDELQRISWDGSTWLAVGGDRTIIETGCLGRMLAVDRALLQLPLGETVSLELALSEPVDDDTVVAITSSHPGRVEVPASVEIRAGSDRTSVPVTGLDAGVRVTLTYSLPAEAGGGVLTSLVDVQPPGWTPRRIGGRVAP